MDNTFQRQASQSCRWESHPDVTGLLRFHLRKAFGPSPGGFVLSFKLCGTQKKWKGHPYLETHPLCHVSKCKDTASALRSWNQAVDTGTVPDELATLTRKTQAEACCSRVHMEEQSSHLPLQHLDCVKKTPCRRLNCLEALRKAGVKARSLAQPTPEEKKIQKIGLNTFKAVALRRREEKPRT